MPSRTWLINKVVSERGLPVARWPKVIAGDWFSPNLIISSGSGYEIAGELNSLDDSALLFLDDLEGAGAPFGFTRIEKLGHRNSRVTMEVYARWIQPDDTGAAAVVPDYSQTIRAVGK